MFPRMNLLVQHRNWHRSSSEPSGKEKGAAKEPRKADKAWARVVSPKLGSATIAVKQAIFRPNAQGPAGLMQKAVKGVPKVAESIVSKKSTRRLIPEENKATECGLRPSHWHQRSPL